MELYEKKTKNQLIDEIERLKKRVLGLEQSLSNHNNAKKNSSDKLLQTSPSKDIYEVVINSTPDWIFAKDKEFRYILVNEGYASAFNKKPKDFIGKDDIEMGFPKEFVLGNSKKNIVGFRNDDIAVLNGESIHNANDLATIGDNSVHVFDTHKVPLRDKDNNVYAVLGFCRDITQLRDAETKLKKFNKNLEIVINERTEELFKSNKKLEVSEKKANDIIDNTKLQMWAYDGKTYTYLNNEWYNFTGQNRNLPLTSNIWDECVHPDDLAAASKKWIDNWKNKTPYTNHFRLKREDGVYRNFYSYATPIFDKNGVFKHYHGFNVDITQRVEAEKKIRKLSMAVRQSPSAISITDISGALEFVNPRFSELTGYSTEEALGKNPRILKADNQADKIFTDLWKTISSGKTWRGEFKNKKKNGDLFWESASISPVFSSENKIISYIKVAEDITERKKTDLKLQNNIKELKERNEELDAFSHTVAHDLKTPLSAIIGFSELLKDNLSNFSEIEINDYLNTIFRGGMKMQQIIEALLLFANMRKKEVDAVEIDMEEIVAESISRLSHLIESSGAEIIVPKKWPKVEGYASWVEEVWTNFISNSIKFGGKPPRIKLGFGNQHIKNIPKGMICFWIHDNGDGISAENQALLFKKFERFDHLKNDGHGLGLSIVKRIVNKLGGEVGVKSDSNPEDGTLFFFTLPDFFFSEQIKLSGVTNMKQNEEMKKLKILIAEDEEFADKILRFILNDYCDEILHAKTGSEAVELCQKNPDIDLVLMDIRMPVMNGYQATKEIKKTNDNIKIIAQTAYALKGDREKAIDAGCDDYISKPIDNKTLIKLIKKLF